MRLAHLASLAALLAVAAATAAVLLTGGPDPSPASATVEHVRGPVEPLAVRSAGSPPTRAHVDRRTHKRRAPKRVRRSPAAQRRVSAQHVQSAPAARAPQPRAGPVRHRQVPKRRAHRPERHGHGPKAHGHGPKGHAPRWSGPPAPKRPGTPPTAAPGITEKHDQQPAHGGGPKVDVGIEVPGLDRGIDVHGGGKPGDHSHGGGD